MSHETKVYFEIDLNVSGTESGGLELVGLEIVYSILQDTAIIRMINTLRNNVIFFF